MAQARSSNAGHRTGTAPTYNSFYGFSSRPFRLNPDPRFFFPSSVHGRALEYLRYGMGQGEGFVVITGEPGTGKTQLMRTLIAESQSPQLETFEIVTSLLDGDDILQLLLASLNIPTQGVQKDEQLVLLRNYLFSRSCQGVRVLALIDEAHGLTPRAFEDLRQLSMNFKFGGKAPLQCFLFGHTTLLHRLGMPDMVQFQQRVIANCHLPPLTALETIKYVEFRLTQAGWKGGPHFTAGAFALLHQHTEGVPRRINSFCDRLLQFAATQELRSIDEHTGLAALQELQQESPQRVALAINNTPASFDSPRLLPDPYIAAASAKQDNLRIKPTQHHEPRPVAFNSKNSQSSQNSPAKKTVGITDENPIDDDAGIPLLMDKVQTQHRVDKVQSQHHVDKMPFGRRVDVDQVQSQHRVDQAQSWHLAAPRVADKALARLRHFWQAPHRRSPTWIALATTVVVTATLGMLGLTTTPDESAQPTPLQVETSATSSPLAKIERTPELTLPPSADLGDDVMASIAPLVSDPSGSPAMEAALNRPIVDQQPAMPKADRTASLAPSTPIRTVTAEQRVAALRRPAQRKPTVRFAAETDLVNRLASPPLSLAKTADLPTPAPTSNAAVRFAAQTSEDVTTVQEDPLKRAKLAALLTQFKSAYQGGNMPQLTRLFATDARTDDEQGRAEIARVYQRLFDVTDRREIGIDNVEWEIRAGQAHGAAHFVVTVVEKGALAPRSYTGTLSIVIKPDQEGLVIAQLHHKYASR